MNNSYKKEWDESYERDENNILYPHDEVVKFLNRFVRKKLNFQGKFKDILSFNQTVKGLKIIPPFLVLTSLPKGSKP